MRSFRVVVSRFAGLFEQVLHLQAARAALLIHDPQNRQKQHDVLSRSLGYAGRDMEWLLAQLLQDVGRFVLTNMMVLEHLLDDSRVHGSSMLGRRSRLE